MRTLLIDIDTQRTTDLKRVLGDAGIELFEWDDSSSDLYATMEELQPEIVIVDVDSPSRDTLEHVAALRATTPQPVLMLAKQSNDGIRRLAAEIGVSLYVVDALSVTLMQSLIDVTITHFKSFEELRREVGNLEQALRERRHIDRAKWLLMQRHGLSESQAHELMRKNAMHQRRTVGDIARTLVEFTGEQRA